MLLFGTEAPPVYLFLPFFSMAVDSFMIDPAIAAMHGPHSVFDICHCTVVHCDAGGVSLVDQ